MQYHVGPFLAYFEFFLFIVGSPFSAQALFSIRAFFGAIWIHL